MIEPPYEFDRERLKDVKGVSELAPDLPKYIIKLKNADTTGRHYHPAFYIGYWHSLRGENYFHEDVEAYWKVTPIESYLDDFKKIGTWSHVPCWFYKECKNNSKDNCRCCWCDGNLKNGEILQWNSKTKSYDYVIPA